MEACSVHPEALNRIDDCIILLQVGRLMNVAVCMSAIGGVHIDVSLRGRKHEYGDGAECLVRLHGPEYLVTAELGKVPVKEHQVGQGRFRIRAAVKDAIERFFAIFLQNKGPSRRCRSCHKRPFRPDKRLARYLLRLRRAYFFWHELLSPRLRLE